MSILPKNELLPKQEFPQMNFIYGRTMEGKSYLAHEFPNTLDLNTDGNSKKMGVPNIVLRNERNNQGKITKTVTKQLGEIFNELRNTKHDFKTINVDVVDDLITLIDEVVLEGININEKAKWEKSERNKLANPYRDITYLGDPRLTYGNGWGQRNALLEAVIANFNSMVAEGYYVNYISRLKTVGEGATERDAPSLSETIVNKLNGSCDLFIKCSKMGNNYVRQVDKTRKAYYPDLNPNEDTRVLYATIRGAYARDVDKKQIDALIEAYNKK